MQELVQLKLRRPRLPFSGFWGGLLVCLSPATAVSGGGRNFFQALHGVSVAGGRALITSWSTVGLGFRLVGGQFIECSTRQVHDHGQKSLELRPAQVVHLERERVQEKY